MAPDFGGVNVANTVGVVGKPDLCTSAPIRITDVLPTDLTLPSLVRSINLNGGCEMVSAIFPVVRRISKENFPVDKPPHVFREIPAHSMQSAFLISTQIRYSYLWGGAGPKYLAVISSLIQQL